MPETLSPERYPRRKIFVLSSLALFTAGTSFALRGAIIADVVAELRTKFPDGARAAAPPCGWEL